MWEQFFGLLPPWLTLTSAILSAVIPLLFFKIHRKLREFGDPPWKKKE